MCVQVYLSVAPASAVSKPIEILHGCLLIARLEDDLKAIELFNQVLYNNGEHAICERDGTAWKLPKLFNGAKGYTNVFSTLLSDVKDYQKYAIGQAAKLYDGPGSPDVPTSSTSLTAYLSGLRKNPDKDPQKRVLIGPGGPHLKKGAVLRRADLRVRVVCASRRCTSPSARSIALFTAMAWQCTRREP